MRGENRMSQTSIENRVAEIVKTLLSGESIELVDVEFIQEREWYLRVYIDKPGGIELEDCEGLSRKLDTELDEHDFIQRSYHLEVSSPGLDRPIRKDSDFARYSGKIVDISFFAPKNGRKMLTGELVGLENDHIVVSEAGNLQKWLRSEIAMVRLHLDIPSGKKKSNK
jgi:ribosome maturation factor RimP